jgi:hypothetical protein
LWASCQRCTLNHFYLRTIHHWCFVYSVYISTGWNNTVKLWKLW